MNEVKLQRELKLFRGTSRYYKHLFPGKSPILLTEGCKYVRDEMDAYWLFDTIVKYQEELEPKNINFQIWELERLKKDLTWLLTCREHLGEKPIIRQPIEYSNFPLDFIRMWLVGGIMLLPSES
jgi:hypothetical protein